MKLGVGYTMNKPKLFQKHKTLFISLSSLLVLCSLSLNIYFLFFTKTNKKQTPILHPKKEFFSPSKAYEDAVNWFYRENRKMIPYAEDFPNLKVEPTKGFVAPKKKTVYLTFDDGPSKVTKNILDLLDQYDAKATFFVTGQNFDKPEVIEILKDIVKRGHTIGLHSHSHSYKEIYSSVENYLKDLNNLFEAVKKHTGIEPNIVRLPGGSVNSHNQHIYQEIIAQVINRGFVIHDWNVASQDTSPTQNSSTQIAHNVTRGIPNVTTPVVLFHDDLTRKSTYNALPTILSYCKENGYDLKGLNNTVMPAFFYYKN